jgi:hypothetical protein
MVVVVQAKADRGSEQGAGRPVFGSGKGMLVVHAEDDEHLKDFDEYMR